MRLMQLPARPHPGIGPSDTVFALCLSLQHNNVPAPSAGLRRLFDFCSFECRSALTARQGARTVERFVEYAHSPAFAELVNAARFSVSAATVSAGTETRGDLATVLVSVDGWASDGAEAGAVVSEPSRFRWMLQRERRPPHEGCWFVTEVVNVKHHFLFNGDSGGTTTE